MQTGAPDVSRSHQIGKLFNRSTPGEGYSSIPPSFCSNVDVMATLMAAAMSQGCRGRKTGAWVSYDLQLLYQLETAYPWVLLYESQKRHISRVYCYVLGWANLQGREWSGWRKGEAGEWGCGLRQSNLRLISRDVQDAAALQTCPLRGEEASHLSHI